MSIKVNNRTFLGATDTLIIYAEWGNDGDNDYTTVHAYNTVTLNFVSYCSTHSITQIAGAGTNVERYLFSLAADSTETSI